MSIKNEVIVGLFFFIAMTILGYFTIIMSGEIFQRYEYYRITVLFPNIEGLGINDKVKVNGVLSGTVEDIQLKENVVLVKLKMYNKFTLYENYKIKIKNETALGGKYVSIKPGSRTLEGKDFAVIEVREELVGETIEEIRCHSNRIHSLAGIADHHESPYLDADISRHPVKIHDLFVRNSLFRHPLHLRVTGLDTDVHPYAAARLHRL